MDSLHKKKRNQILALVIPCAGLAFLIGYNIKSPAPEEKQAAAFTKTILDAGVRGPEQMSAAEREDLHRQWQRFSPDNRRKIFQEIARYRLQQMRRQTEKLTPEERTKQINRALEQMRSRRQRLSGEAAADLRERVLSDDGREIVRNILDFYQRELSAAERAELDPLIHEWLYQIEELTGGRR